LHLFAATTGWSPDQMTTTPNAASALWRIALYCHGQRTGSDPVERIAQGDSTAGASAKTKKRTL
jgi:hypothetical protein